jgi:hypothetical protein
MVSRSLDVLFAKQPMPGLDGCPEPLPELETYGKVLRHLIDHEGDYVGSQGLELRPVLIRNKDLLQQLLGEVPETGTV